MADNNQNEQLHSEQTSNSGKLLEIFMTALKLGLTSFGGPVAHLGYFKDEYVDRKKWLDDKLYADIIALCQFLPGPASSQVGISIGMMRGGILGGVLSWLGFTMPSVIVLVIFAMLYLQMDISDQAFISSLKVVAVAVVLHAIMGMAKNLTPDKPRIIIAIIASGVMLIYPNVWVQILTILGGALVGFVLFQKRERTKIEIFNINIPKKVSYYSLAALGGLLVLMPLLANWINNIYITLFDVFFRVGAIVFGGGHVVLPMIEREIVPAGLISSDAFLAGYGMAQAVPGPLFTFASYLGAIIADVPGAIVATIAVFLPSFLLIIAALPFLAQLRENHYFQSALMGVNATVVGILVAAFYDPILTNGIVSGGDFFLGLVLFMLLIIWKLPAWSIVLIGLGLGYLLNFL
ncbi:chromate efflux transporter [Aliicoccus persicus]|uniref:Chromate transporter n=1 Tax=Aliicoccus persicus TaxID=930138 RepID=A0A662Z6F8_9STAP|nr:chromate efflux transporter [Aliicoccus persicus]SEW15734.1 chromate transporter [Aliicoccus persicus]